MQIHQRIDIVRGNGVTQRVEMILEEDVLLATFWSGDK
jgi:hypothetical protein